MKSKHDKTNGSNGSDKDSTNGKNGANNDDSMSGGEDRSRSGSPSRNDKGSASADKIDHDALSIYIGNVDYSATEEELRNTFISCGEIVRVTIIKNMKTGHPKGAAFIEFKDKDGVQAAMGLNGKEVKGRPLIVTSKKPRPENKPRDRQNFDRRQPRSGPPPYGAGPGGPYGGGRSQYPPNRGGYYQGGGGGGFGGGQRGGQPPVPIDPTMQRMPQTRYDPYRRPDMYDPYMMRGNAPPPAPVYYGAGGGGGGHHGGNYQDKMGSGGHGGQNHGGGGGGSRAPQQNQRYSSHQFNRR